MLTPGSFFAIIIVIAFAFIIILGVKIVPQGFEYVVERFGRYQKTLSPGLTLILPLMDRVANKVNMKGSISELFKQINLQSNVSDITK